MSFPSLGVLDDFNRANGAASGWAALDSGGGLTIDTNQGKGPTSDTAGYYNVSTYGPDCAAYFTHAAKSGGDARLVGVLARIASPGTTFNGYGVMLDDGAKTLTICKYTAGVKSVLATKNYDDLTPGFIYPVVGDKYGIVCQGTTIEAWQYPAVQAAWQKATSTVDATYSAAGYLGLRNASGSLTRFDDFGGGTIVPVALDETHPDADITTTGWTTAPLFSKVNDASDSTVISATAS